MKLRECKNMSKENITIKELKVEDLDNVLDILHLDSLRYADGDYPGPGWVGDIINSKEQCFSLGLYENNILISVILAEKLIHGGCMLWYIATKVEKQGKGFGGILLEHFEKFAKERDRKWIFLNATNDSLGFYKKHGFVTSKYSTVYEHYKDL